MKIKSGDNVKVISGREKGKIGKVIQVLKNKRTGAAFVVIENVNLRKKHLRPKKSGDKGQVIELANPIAISNVMLIDPSSKKPTRVGYVREGDVKKRVAKVSNIHIG